MDIEKVKYTSNYDKDIIRIIGQHLVGLGYKQTVNTLLEESGIERLEHPLTEQFIEQILSGQWDKATQMLDSLLVFVEGDDTENKLNEMRLLIAEQNFLEYLEDGQLLQALKCLRSQLTPYQKDNERLNHFIKLLMCHSHEEVRSKANWSGKGTKSRMNLVDKFHQYLPPSVMIPPKRLKNLIQQASQYQMDHCLLHNPTNNPNVDHIDIMVDHECDPKHFPFTCVQELPEHVDEVWFCKFSNSGSSLATGGVSGKVIIWQLDPDSHLMKKSYSEKLPCNGIVCLSWSPDDSILLACGSDEKPDCWFLDIRNKQIKTKIERYEEEYMSTCSWHQSGEMFALASTRGNFTLFDKNAVRKGSREGVRVQCLSFLNHDTENILAADSLNRIKLYRVTRDMSLDNDEEDVLEERHPIVSFTIDSDDKYIAVNLMKQGIHLWDFRHKTLLRMYCGVKQYAFAVYSSFSPYERKFLASGSEDGKIYVYRVDKDEPIAVLDAHLRTVSCVSWNPKIPDMLASVSDDRRVKIWGPAERLDSIANKRRL